MKSMLFSWAYKEFDEELKAGKVLIEPDLTIIFVSLFINWKSIFAFVDFRIFCPLTDNVFVELKVIFVLSINLFWLSFI